MRSASNAFRASDGVLLDGNVDGVTGGDYSTNFNIISTDRTVSIPDVVRGPGQELRVNPTETGIPVKLNNGQDVYRIELSVNFDPSLVNVTDLALAPALVGNLNLTWHVNSPGRIDITGISPTGLPAGAQNLFYLKGNVPANALYRTKCELKVTNLMLYRQDGTTFSTTADGGLMLNSYPGDVTGDGRYNSLDSLRIQRYLVNLDRSFTQYPLVDPVEVADVTGDGRVNSLDSLYLQRYLVNIPVSYITTPPVSSVTQTTGLDPIIRLPELLTLRRGETIRVPVEIFNSDTQAIDLSSFETAIAINPAMLQFVSVQTVGQNVVKVDSRSGRIAFAGVIPQTRLQPGDSFTFAWLTLKVRPLAKLVDTAINLLDEVSIGRQKFVTSLNSGDLVLSHVPTAGTNDAVDSRVVITGKPVIQPSLLQPVKIRPLTRPAMKKAALNGISKRQFSK